MTVDHKSVELVGNSPSIKAVQHLVQQVANKRTTALILGDSGTGKELVARVIHDLSERAKGPFVAVNCAAIPLELLESELFGHEKGAFTGAFVMRQGRFELAQGGTLFLDEIGDMPIFMQAKLLRILQEKTFERVGGSKPIATDVRIISATHKNLEQCMLEGSFREDLYYRLNVFPIKIPALKDRKEDISLLIRYFIEKFAESSGSTIEVSSEVMSFLEQYEWPGNVRELANLIERLIILYPGKVIYLQDLPEQFHQPSVKANDKNVTMPSTKEIYGANQNPNFDLKEHLAQLEFTLITRALNDSHGVVARAAKKLGLRRTTLVEKMKKYRIVRELETKTHSELG